MESERAAGERAERIAGALIVAAPVRSVILHGSATTGDFVPGVSDLDLLVVVDRPLDAGEIAALTALIATASVAPAGGIDLDVVTAETATVPSRTPPAELHLGRHPGAALEVELKIAAAPDLPAELSTAREGYALLGSAPHAVLGPVDPSWLLARSEHWLTTWLTRLDDEEHAAFMALTACRMWHYALAGTHTSKSAAARWALDRDPSLTAVRQAMRHRAGDQDATIAEDDLRAVLHIARHGVAQA
jgi:hypothetical protein